MCMMTKYYLIVMVSPQVVQEMKTVQLTIIAEAPVHQVIKINSAKTSQTLPMKYHALAIKSKCDCTFYQNK